MLYKKFDEKEVYRIESFLSHHMANPYSEIYRSSAPLDKRLAEWDKAKSKYLYRLLGDHFILEKPIEYAEAPANLSRQISQSYSYGGKMRPFRDIYNSWAANLNFDYWSSESTVLYSLLSSECLCNATLGEYSYIRQYLPITINFGEGRKIKFETTTKPIRALGKIVKMFNLDKSAFEEFRLEHSRILNTKKVKGTLCLSIHPLDYMTMSTNCERWTSCMNWTEPGGYRGGTIEVMNSPMVVVAYLKSTDNEYQWSYNQRWNSKKWRMLALVHPDAILSIKAYPYHHEGLAREVIEWLKELAATNVNLYMGKIEKVPACSTFEYQDTHTWYNVDLQEGRMMYCDWGCDTHYGCFTLNPEELETSQSCPATKYFNYCGPMTCMCCGSQGDYYDESYVVCESCCSYGDDEDCCYCEHCGDRIYPDDAYWIGDYPYCCDCINEVATRCAVDDEYHYYEDLERVYLAHNDDEPDVDEDEYVYIYSDYCTGGRYGTCISARYTSIDNPRKTEDGIWYFNRADLTANGFQRLYQLYGGEVARYFSSNN